ncbi:3-methyladenine DNA glycosylase [Bacillus sp. T33-2]|nr:3-methyladenine DNA glycosylase [Bacillus sp. T33-2]PLR97538.1 3-methyladenine DNA glycosylase [Bacillus sp. T33-2]
MNDKKQASKNDSLEQEKKKQQNQDIDPQREPEKPKHSVDSNRYS